MTGILPQTMPEVVVERLLNGALEGVVLAALAWVLLKAVGTQDFEHRGLRFGSWFCSRWAPCPGWVTSLG